MNASAVALTDTQQRIWFATQIDSQGIAYILAHGFRLRGRLDEGAVATAFANLVARHDALRLSFHVEDDRLVQVPHAHVPVAPIVEELAPPAGDAGLSELVAARLKLPFDLGKPGLIRLHLFRLAPDDHVLAISLHHLVADGWSISTLLEDFAALYEAAATGTEPPPPPALGFLDHVAAAADRGDDGSALAYWTKYLEGATDALPLPLDRPRPARPSGRGALLRTSLDAEASERVRAFCSQRRITPYMAFLLAFQIVLHRYSGADDFLVGMPVAGRDDEAADETVGLFVRTLVSRARLAGNPEAGAVLDAIRDDTLMALQHQDVDFDGLRRIVDPGGGGVFRVMFVYQGKPMVLPPLTGLAATPFALDMGGSKFDLTLDAEEGEAGFHLTFEYDTDIFDHATIARFARHLTRALDAVIAQPTLRVGEVPLLDEAERDLVLRGWNRTAAPFDTEARIDTLFDRRAAALPEAAALIEGGRSVSYRELAQKVDALAAELRALGASQEAPVGIFLERSANTVAALLAAMKAGAPYVPLDTGHPDERVRTLIEAAGCRIVVTGARHAGRLGPGLQCLDIDAPRSAPVTPLATAGGSGDLAYVIFTSGSTGVPKGVEGTHRAAINRFAWMWNRYPFRVGEISAQKTSLGFVDSIWEIFGPLLAGIPNVIIPNEVALDPEAFLGTLATHKVSRLVLVPSLLRVMLDHAPDLGARLPDLTLWSASGEPLPADTVRRFAAAVPHGLLLNIYGSSEVTADVTWQEVAGPGIDISSLPHTAPIGRPIANTQIHLLDRYMNPVPPGVHGQIHVGGEAVARGHWRRPDLTAERFIPDPFGVDGSKRLFATGDLGRYDAGGVIEHLGRMDNQVKVRGARVELGEVEAALLALPGVREVVVSVRGASPETRSLVAHVVADGAEPLVLRRALAEKLPDYMVPSLILPIARIPRLPSGKVDRSALPDSSAPPRAAAPAPTAAGGDDRAALVAIWREVLKRDDVDNGSTFFELGGHSLLAMQVLSRIRRNFLVEIPVRTLFDEPDIDGLLAAIERARRNGATVSAPAIVARPRPTVSVDQLIAQLDGLSPEDVARLRSALNARS